MNTTYWITNFGEKIQCPPNGHYDYIQQNFTRLFGRAFLNESEVHDKPYNHGYIHVQNHFNTFNVRGQHAYISKHKNIIRDMIFDRLMENRDFVVNIEYNNKAKINPYGAIHSFNMPVEYDNLRAFLS
jgi:hypothetical protein